MSNQYEDRDAFELDKAGGYYTRHVVAMTKEGLHSKSDIAAELAHRDYEIDKLKAQVEQLRKASMKVFFNYNNNLSLVDVMKELTKVIDAHQLNA